MNNHSTHGAGDLEKATAAIRASAAAVTPSSRSVQAMLAALDAFERGSGSDAAPRRQVMSSGRGSLSLTEDALMKKWRFHDAFRPLSFEALERRRLLAAVTQFQDDAGADRRAAWPDSFFLPVIHARGEQPQRRWDAHPGCDAPRCVDSKMPELLADGRFNELVSSAPLFGSELIFAA